MIRAIASALLVITTASSAFTSANGQTFQTVVVDVGGPYQDLWEIDLDGDSRDELVFLIEEPKRHLLVYRQASDGNSFSKPTTWTVPAGCAAFAFADVVSPAGRDLLLLDHAGASVVAGNSTTGSPERWLDHPLLFPPGYSGTPAHWAYGRDVDGDGRQDLLLPGLETDLIVHGGKEGRPRSPVMPLLAPRSDATLSRTTGSLGVRNARPRVALVDLQKGGPVPAWLGRNGLHCLPRTETGFAAAPRLLFKTQEEAAAGLGLLRRTDVDLDDLNGDGLLDLVLTRTEARGGTVPERRTDLLFFLNEGSTNERPAQILLLPGVLSSGPDIADVDGDGRSDLLLSVFAGDLKGEMSRRLFGRVTLDYHLYLGQKGARPFPRSPSLSLRDKVPNELFETWGRRHRKVVADDFDRDGRLDLVSFSPKKDRCTITIRPGRGRGASFAFSDDGPSITVEAVVTSYTVVALAPQRPAARLKTKTGVIYVHLVD